MRLTTFLIVVGSLLVMPSSASAIAINAGPANPTNMTSATFTFALEEGETAMTYSSIQCVLDGAVVQQPCASPYTHPTALGAGNHEFIVNGLSGTTIANSAHHPWTIDLTPPAVSITAGPSGETTARSATFEVASEPGSTFQCAIDSTTLTPCASPVTYSALAIGNHTFRVTATDPAGNVSAQVTRTWTIRADNTPPETTITAAPSGVNTILEPTVEFTSNEAGTFQCSLNGGPFIPCKSPRVLAGLVDGAITFQVRAVDLAENIDPTAATASWTRDTTAPAPPALSIGLRGRKVQLPSDETPVFHTSIHLRTAWALAADATAFQVERRSTRAGVDPELGTWTPWKQGVKPLRSDTTVATGTTGCIRARAVDAVGNASVWTVRCTTVPYRANSASVTRPFLRGRGAGHFAGQYVRFAGRGQRRGYLRIQISPRGTGAEVKRVSLVAMTCPRCGAVRVVVTGDGRPPVRPGDVTAARTVSLRSSRTSRSRVLPAIVFNDAFPRLERRFVYVFAVGRGGDRRIEGIGISSL